MDPVPFCQEIFLLQQNCIAQWKNEGLTYSQQSFLALVEENHAFNFQLWNAEDRARRDDQGFEYVYRAKREIDGFNQQRNNRMEAMDAWLYEHLKPSNCADCSVHSETPGMIIDRLSILSLKVFHMELQTQRQEVTAEHRQQCLYKLAILREQQQQLQHCLIELFGEVQRGRRRFRVYHQFKMYNDPSLNPQLYGQRTAEPTA